MSSIPIIDIIFIILIVLMVIHGLLKGFIGELFSWAPKVLAICIAVFLYPAGANFIRQRFIPNMKFVPEIIAFVIIFIAIILILKLLEHLLKDIIAGAKLGGIDKLLGAIFGLVEGVALTAAIVLVLAIQPLFDASKVIGDSFFAQYLLPLLKIPLSRGKEVINTVLLILPGIRFLA